jgi:hypothetical protein
VTDQVSKPHSLLGECTGGFGEVVNSRLVEHEDAVSKRQSEIGDRLLEFVESFKCEFTP